MPELNHDLARLDLHADGVYFVDQAGEVGVIAGEFGIFVGWLDVAWDAPGTPASQLRDVVHLPFRNPDLLAEELSAARAKRGTGLLTCALCGTKLPPGRMDQINGRPVCHECAETKLGVVH